jgi:hypothetical protein
LCRSEWKCGTSREGGEATSRCRDIEEIQKTLGASSETSTAAALAMSLRELWLKKLEAKAVLSLLEKLDRIRAAPMQSDSYYLQQHRIGAAVITVAQALDTILPRNYDGIQRSTTGR